MTQSTLRLNTITCAIALHCAAFGNALAQSAGTPQEEPKTTVTIDRIEISARKRSEPLQEVPVAAKTFSATEIADQSIVDLKSLAFRTAGATTVELGTGFASEVVLRGSGAGRAVNAETATGLYRNGAYAAGGNIGGRSFNKMDFFDVQSIEVMRGPQGALYGRGAVGGAMNIINYKPQATRSDAVSLSYKDHDSLGLEAISNIPISDALQLRAGIMSNHRRDGVYRDKLTGHPLDEEHFNGGRLSIAFRPGGSFKYNLLMDGYAESGPSFGVMQVILANPDDRFLRSLNTPAKFRRNESTIIGEGVWDLGSSTVTALTQIKRRNANTSDDFDRYNNLLNVNLDNWQRIGEDHTQRFGQELRIAGPEGQDLQWLAGLEYPQLKDAFTVDLNGAVNNARPNNSLNRTQSKDKSVGIFGLLGYDLTRQLNLTGELRQNTDEKNFTLQSTTNTFPTGTSAAAQNTGPVATTTLEQPYVRKFASLAKVLSLTHKASSTLTSYIRYGEAFRPGGFNNDPDRNTSASNPSGPRFSIPYEQEQSKTTELGLKMEWLARALRINGALYRTDMQDLLINNNVSTTPPGSSTSRVIQFVENAGAARIDGLEIDFNLNVQALGPSGRLIVDGSANALKPTFTAGRYVNLNVPQTRPRQGTVGVTYELRPFGLARAFINVNQQMLSGGYQDGANLTPLDFVRISNLNAGIKGKDWMVKMNVSNLSNFLYVTNYNNVQRTTGYTNPPRTWSLTATFFL
ncbi:MAG: hypothetical protein D4S02_08885 [Rhodocyclaceae bacterium]|nr:MAG: hypothetical protein D4S02_08885 [Rhodocyclaceae bacterium]